MVGMEYPWPIDQGHVQLSSCTTCTPDVWGMGLLPPDPACPPTPAPGHSYVGQCRGSSCWFLRPHKAGKVCQGPWKGTRVGRATLQSRRWHYSLQCTELCRDKTRMKELEFIGQTNLSTVIYVCGHFIWQCAVRSRSWSCWSELCLDA